MNRKWTTAVILGLALALSPALARAAEPEKPSAPPSAEEMKAMMAAMQEAAKPGPEHQRLAKLEGKWTKEYHFFTGHGAPAQVSTGDGENKMILGGRFLTMESSGSMAGMKIEAFQIAGFDRRSGLYTFFGCDTAGTYCVSAAGNWDEATKTITYHGIEKDPSNGHTEEYDLTLHWVSDDETNSQFLFKMADGSMFKVVEIIAKRVR